VVRTRICNPPRIILRTGYDKKPTRTLSLPLGYSAAVVDYNTWFGSELLFLLLSVIAMGYGALLRPCLMLQAFHRLLDARTAVRQLCLTRPAFTMGG
jgi:hypothetical protein